MSITRSNSIRTRRRQWGATGVNVGATSIDMVSVQHAPATHISRNEISKSGWDLAWRDSHVGATLSDVSSFVHCTSGCDP